MVFVNPKTREEVRINPGMLYTMGDARAFLGVERKTLRRYIQDGRLPATNISGTRGNGIRYRIWGRDLLEFAGYRPEVA